MNPAWLDDLLACRDRGEAAVMVTVASVRGSAPREAGAKMIVTAATVLGTIGGGHLEYKAIAIAGTSSPPAIRRRCDAFHSARASGSAAAGW